LREAAKKGGVEKVRFFTTKSIFDLKKGLICFYNFINKNIIPMAGYFETLE